MSLFALFGLVAYVVGRLAVTVMGQVLSENSDRIGENLIRCGALLVPKRERYEYQKECLSNHRALGHKPATQLIHAVGCAMWSSPAIGLRLWVIFPVSNLWRTCSNWFVWVTRDFAAWLFLELGAWCINQVAVPGLRRVAERALSPPRMLPALLVLLTALSGSVASSPAGDLPSAISLGHPEGVTVGSFMFFDSDGDGSLGLEEEVVVDATVRLYPADDLQVPLATVVTNADGEYEFGDVEPGVEFVLQVIWSNLASDAAPDTTSGSRLLVLAAASFIWLASTFIVRRREPPEAGARPLTTSMVRLKKSAGHDRNPQPMPYGFQGWVYPLPQVPSTGPVGRQIRFGANVQA